MKLSVVTTLYRSAPCIDEFYCRMTDTVRKFTDQYEIILVNDGSPDDSAERAINLANLDEHVFVVDLSRNFGHHKAMTAGLAHARGDLVFLIDSYLEEEPEWLLPFAEQMQSECCDVVYGIQSGRKRDLFERWSGRWFYICFHFLTGVDLPENTVTARLMTRRYVDALLRFEEREVFIAGLWHIAGYVQKAHEVIKRNSRKTDYAFRPGMSQIINAVTSFNNAPLVGIFYIGGFISCVAFICCAYLVMNWMFFSTPLSGWTSTMASIWLIGGMVIFFLGIVGIYIAKVFSETKHRPSTIIRHVYGRGKKV